MIWYYDTIFVVGALSFTFPSIVKEAFFTPHPHRRLSVTFLMIDNVIGVRWYLTLAFISIALIINNVEHLFTCLKAISISLKIFSSSLLQFLKLGWLILSCMCFLAINTLPDISLANTFTYSVFGFFSICFKFSLPCKCFLVWCSCILFESAYPCLFLILEKMLLAFQLWRWNVDLMLLKVAHEWPLLCWGVFLLHPHCWKFCHE